MEVILHILTDLNGKISGPMFEDECIGPALEAYGLIRTQLDCDGVVYGRTTMEEGYCDGVYSRRKDERPAALFPDHKVPGDHDSYIISLDPEGTLVWNKGTICRKGRPAAHVIQVLTGKASRPYLDLLERCQVSYICAGEETIDLVHVLAVLEAWGIRRLMVAGGGGCDGSFLQAGCLAALSLVSVPIAQADPSAVYVFESETETSTTFGWTLKEARQMPGSVLWQYYEKRQ